MYLEDIVKEYGMTDYYDRTKNLIYAISESMPEGDGGSRLIVPVRTKDNRTIGYCYMARITE